MQKLFHIKNKYSRKIGFQKGDNWFSITDDLARFVLKKKLRIEQVFKYSCCGDELFCKRLLRILSIKKKYMINFLIMIVKQ